jgi:hypothetical protein
MRSLSLYKVAKDISLKTGISLQAVYKKVKSELLKGENIPLCENTDQTTINGKTSIHLNNKAVSEVYKLYNLDIQLVDQPVNQPSNTDTEHPCQQHNELLKAYINLANRLADITNESQTIAKQQQQLALADKGISALPSKRSFFSRLFSRQH